MNKRRAANLRYSKQRYQEKRLNRLSTLVDSLSTNLVESIREDVTATQYARLQTKLHGALSELLRSWIVDHERRSKLIIQIEEIESRGKTAVVVAREDNIA